MNSRVTQRSSAINGRRFSRTELVDARENAMEGVMPLGLILLETGNFGRKWLNTLAQELVSLSCFLFSKLILS